MNSNVNFILNNFNSSKYNSNNQEKSPVKVVKLSKKTKQSGGKWGSSDPEPEPTPSKNKFGGCGPKPLNQSGGWGHKPFK